MAGAQTPTNLDGSTRRSGSSTAVSSPFPTPVSRDAPGRAALWHIRKGLYAAVAAPAHRHVALLEDGAVRSPTLADLCDDLTDLFTGTGTNAV